MANSDFVELVLTCSSWQEAQAIADKLLNQHLVACVEFLEIKSKYWWEAKLDQTKEIKLVMQSLGGHFKAVEEEVKKLSNYETFVLKALPISKLSTEASSWLKEAVSG